MSAEENQATPKEAFGFPAPLTSKRPMKSDNKRESAVCEYRWYNIVRHYTGPERSGVAIKFDPRGYLCYTGQNKRGGISL